MSILITIIYLDNILLSIFAFNQFKTEQQKTLLPHGIIHFIIALTSVYILNNNYFIEALIASTVCSLPIILQPGMTPEFLYRNIKNFNITSLIIIITSLIFGLIIYF